MAMPTEPEATSSEARPESPPWMIPDYPPLKGTALREALSAQTIRYPMVTRGLRDPPIPNQAYSNVSFMFLDTPGVLKSGKKIYGFYNPRGNWPTDGTATADCERIIREVDSRYPVRIGPVGAWLPITPDDAVVADHLDVRMGKSEHHLRDRAAKDAAAKQRTIQRELRERERELQEEVDINDDKDDIRYYTMRRYTDMKLHEAIVGARKKIADMRYNLLKCRVELKRLELKHPTHSGEWLDVYNAERAKTGIGAYVPGEHEFDDYEAATLDAMEPEFDEMVAARNAEP
uniref:Uncharacterized protein n=1 Tax=Marseillevirus LCMAC103 TaxID=2506604 RepID=A0A481YUT3_9VIRU|nr:MAG: uncharacterized protein LCMAC103_04170 [Marseillevirus LCMAC103]